MVPVMTYSKEPVQAKKGGYGGFAGVGGGAYAGKGLWHTSGTPPQSTPPQRCPHRLPSASVSPFASLFSCTVCAVPSVTCPALATVSVHSRLSSASAPACLHLVDLSALIARLCVRCAMAGTTGGFGWSPLGALSGFGSFGKLGWGGVGIGGSPWRQRCAHSDLHPVALLSTQQPLMTPSSSPSFSVLSLRQLPVVGPAGSGERRQRRWRRVLRRSESRRGERRWKRKDWWSRGGRRGCC
jgi:hypothetical protein